MCSCFSILASGYIVHGRHGHLDYGNDLHNFTYLFSSENNIKIDKTYTNEIHTFIIIYGCKLA